MIPYEEDTFQNTSFLITCELPFLSLEGLVTFLGAGGTLLLGEEGLSSGKKNVSEYTKVSSRDESMSKLSS